MTVPSAGTKSAILDTQNFVSSGLYEGYLATNYEVALGPSVAVARIGRRCPAIETFLIENRYTVGHIITAYNPYNCRSSDVENLKQSSALIDWVDRQGILCRPSRNLPQSRGHQGETNWPDEPGCFLLGLTLQEAREIALCFHQAAFISIGTGLAATLIMTAKTGVKTGVLQT